MPTSGDNVAKMSVDDIYYDVKPSDHEGQTWDDVPETIKKTFDREPLPGTPGEGAALGISSGDESPYRILKEGSVD